jgi:hypothetical protein
MDQKYMVYDALCSLCEVSLKMQNSFCNLHDINSLQYLKEFCTIKCCSSRQSGHTTAIVKYCLNNDDNILVIAPNIDMGNKIKKRILSENSVALVDCVIRCYDAYNIYIESIRTFNKARGIAFSTILIDCSSILNIREINEIYEFAMASMKNVNPKFIIFME